VTDGKLRLSEDMQNAMNTTVEVRTGGVYSSCGLSSQSEGRCVLVA